MMLMPRRNSSFDLFDDFFKDDFFPKRDHMLMKTDIKEKDNSYLIEMDLPGHSKENIDIELKDGYLVVSAHSKKEVDDKNGKYVHQERFYGHASRSFYVGEDINTEDIDAKFKDGILMIELPKKEEEKIKKTTKIEIK